MTGESCLAIVLAAGLGTRMKSALPKVLHEIGNFPLVGHVLKAVQAAGADEVAVVVGPDMEALEKASREIVPDAKCFVQVDRLGTAHAAKAAEGAYLESTVDHVLVLFGDTPLVTPQTFRAIRAELSAGSDLVVLGFEAADPHGYGRLITDGDKLLAIREEKDASDEERKVTLCNAGIMGFRREHFASLVNRIENNNAKGEYYLTDAVEVAHADGLKISVTTAAEAEVQGINNRAQLAACEAVFQERMRQSAMADGVTLQAPETVYFSQDTRIAPDVVVEPNVVFGPGVSVESGVRIRAFSHLERASVAKDATVGPYARLRPNAKIGEGAHIGNFVEIKNASIEQGAKVNHLSYIGDARVGAKTNVGAGTITCNYDGYFKYHTDVGNGVFVGSNSILVAPVSIGDGALVAAGSVITEDVPSQAMAFGRAQQVVKEGRASEMRARLEKEKELQKAKANS
ncbi:bifunctional UDP-N-acetylglucosamine diphosphorylase/glucosamine-1-phosphate N-acetyltransferase GlmU [Pseudovibrio exalbescens]|uniref:bifunctional UDP-N-acetylglucosamine diphosphorylase/glucosamine-1-phosphate N-acetyltransferase GlmU n=1 Tax=Pseudovibrio exalbescens TaxID=197461 RepID=UPI0023671A4D|nr:bifunctional UDP-N-acetylglucosamine diphosphorylase/glucosamine-1-phosphate N-acetyltransferase GlmU [Pseudovibrio exalbescens]MDD7908694.1 bifunctional UDP-N-acetylglucosamine diphosphorylase/glucosamine-1-phosphate N-acetyltransferase GlmU [Pseudovibrio exalbescens]